MRKTGYALSHGSLDYHLEVLDARDQICGWIQLPRAGEALPSLTRAADKIILEDVYLNMRANVCYRKAFVTNMTGVGLINAHIRITMEFLRIKWEDNIAYRKGCGLIKKNMWDQHGTEDVDLMFG